MMATRIWVPKLFRYSSDIVTVVVLAEFYTGIFPDTKITDANALVVMLEMSGQKIRLLNGGDMFRPGPAISLMYLTSSKSEVESLYSKLIENGKALMPLGEYPFSPKYGWVEDWYGVSWQLYSGQAEIDKYWIGLTSGSGEESMCGWLKDRYGVSWQIVPSMLDKLMAESPRVTEELMKMKKLDIRKLQEAAQFRH
jgi:predicted 3-demethylubiquinone-9 3-methyltransferase (glyoxalase superfamily)